MFHTTPRLARVRLFTTITTLRHAQGKLHTITTTELQLKQNPFTSLDTYRSNTLDFVSHPSDHPDGQRSLHQSINS